MGISPGTTLTEFIEIVSAAVIAPNPTTIAKKLAVCVALIPCISQPLKPLKLKLVVALVLTVNCAFPKELLGTSIHVPFSVDGCPFASNVATIELFVPVATLGKETSVQYHKEIVALTPNVLDVLLSMAQDILEFSISLTIGPLKY